MPEKEDASRREVERQVLDAADRLVGAFGGGRVEDYFACFHPQATFVFYTTDRRLESTAEWRGVWDSLEREEDFKVLECRSQERRVQVFGRAAVFTHDVETRVSTRGGGDPARAGNHRVRPGGGWRLDSRPRTPLPRCGRQTVAWPGCGLPTYPLRRSPPRRRSRSGRA